MDLESERRRVTRIGAVALLVGILLLVAPWTPPQVALSAFVGLFVLGLVVYYGVSYVARELSQGWSEAAPDEEAEEVPAEMQELRERYLNDPSFTEADYEAAVEAVMADRDDDRDAGTGDDAAVADVPDPEPRSGPERESER